MAFEVIQLSELLPTLEARFTAALPEIRVRDLAKGVLSTAGVTLYFEQTDLDTATQGQNLAPGFVEVSLNIAVASKYKDTARAIAELNAAIQQVLPVLDGFADIRWTAASRGVFDETGTPCYLIPLTVIATYLPEPEPTPEPDPAPAPEEE